ncbi:hypothetical protein F2Q70_00039517 [Brassica cretica]|uniref:Uncharacterized protein n=1 Tax=Brassica cretica TaxID=69181 RepID=A0A8S9K939_BRACR|nr:hypothetical protein F2Q70_00039517 [Brassica cretica]
MSSRKRPSKRNSSSHSSPGDSSANEVIAPKEEFEVEEEAKDAYYKALCGSPPPSQDIPIRKRPMRSPNAPLTSSMASPDYLTTLRDFYQIPSGVVFRIPSGNENAKNPPEGFFTCYEAFLVYCRMWFPIPGTIVRPLHHFGLSISQLSVPALQHWVGVLISSYELGMDLNPGDFEGFWFTRGTGIDGSYRMAPKKGMAIIQGHTSHPKTWFERFFFVRIDGESVEESYLHLFRREWNFTRGGGRFSAVGCAPGWSVSSGFWHEEALSACAARLPGVSKSSLLPLRALVVPRGAFLLAFAVNVSTCFTREATSFPCCVGIDGSSVVRLRVFVSVGRHIELSVCGCERDRSVAPPPSSAKLWEPKFTPSSFVNRRKAKLT